MVVREREGLSRAQVTRRTNSWRRECGVWVSVCNVERTVDHGHGPHILGAVLTTSPGALSRDGLVWRLARWPKLPAFEQLSIDHGPALFMPGPARGVASPLQEPMHQQQRRVHLVPPSSKSCSITIEGWLAHAMGVPCFCASFPCQTLIRRVAAKCMPQPHAQAPHATPNRRRILDSGETLRARPHSSNTSTQSP